MMRRVLLALLTLVILGTLFGVFLLFQGKAPVSVAPDTPTPAPKPTTTTGMGAVGEGEGAWMTVPDRNTGLLKARIRAEKYTPRGNGQIDAERPQAEFFIGKTRDQVIRIEGKTGTLFTAGTEPRLRSDFSMSQTQTPTRGEMRDVTISYYASQADIDKKPPQLTMTLNNAYFDNETYEIATEGYTDASGRQIPGKEVPITVRGESFDFDGQGLYLRWDDKSNQLKTLTIHKSQGLVIKKPFEHVDQPERRADAKTGAGGGDSASNASSSQQRRRTRARNAVAATRPAEDAPGMYRATFKDGVVVTQGTLQLAKAQQMMIDFMAPQEEPKSASANAAAPSAADQVQAKAQAAAKPAEPDKKVAEDSLFAMGEPIVVRWAGEMSVGLVPQEPLHPESSDDAVVRLVGDPVVMESPEGYHLEAVSAAYQVAAQRALVQGSAGKPVRMTAKDGSVLLTPSLEFNQRQGLATLRGPSSGTFIADPEGKREQVQASWSELAQANFANAQKSPTLSRLMLQGNVNIQHPRIQQFEAGVLTLAFNADAPADKTAGEEKLGALKQITAQKDVDAILLSDDGKPVTVRCQSLNLLTAQRADKSVYPSRVEADGAVLAGDKTQQIRCESLRANLADTEGLKEKKPQGGVDLAGLRDLVATGNVEMKSAKGDIARGQRIELRADKENNGWVLLEGSPAYVSREGSSLSGKLIEMNTSNETAVVTGGGQMILAGKLAGQSPAGGGGMELAWSGDARVDGPKDHATIAGDVRMKYVDVDGVVNEAQGDRVDLVLTRLPRQASTTAATGEKKADKKEFTFLSDRLVKALTLVPAKDKEIQLQSLKMRGSYIDYQVTVFGPRLACEFTPLTQTDKNGKPHTNLQLEKLEIPASSAKPSRMLYVSLPPATKQAVKPEDPFKAKALPGATAFAWQDRLVYDRAKSQFEMRGPVLIRHQPQTKQGRSFDINCQTITGELDLDKANQNPAGNVPAEIRRIILAGRPITENQTGSLVQLDSNDLTITAPTMEVYPATSDLLATGTDRNPVTVERGEVVQKLTKASINLETQKVSGYGAAGGGRR